MNEIPIALDEKIQWSIDFAWKICLSKINNNEIKVNKEASLQLHYANILNNILQLVRFSPDERFEIELESSYIINNRQVIADIIIDYKDSKIHKKHSIELKFYKKLAYSGKNRGGSDIFMCEVYKDLHYSELYLINNFVSFTTCLVLTDYEHFINPKNKASKNWSYDISNNFLSEAKIYDTSIGGKKILFELKNQYLFSWFNHGNLWACILRASNS
ncbi:hypothetical protein [Chryseobacterium sp. ERMR1:04]|uniref:hypothetical protein n=1 Tax=Chryseobacterium sp. ERMR1:04 TaxID=1705393 RepID=UPI0006C88007|nr:hypothetical protein [Chryseobacterium sp. ERMR1:04]